MRDEKEYFQKYVGECYKNAIVLNKTREQNKLLRSVIDALVMTDSINTVQKLEEENQKLKTALNQYHSSCKDQGQQQPPITAAAERKDFEDGILRKLQSEIILLNEMIKKKDEELKDLYTVNQELRLQFLDNLKLKNNLKDLIK